MPARSSYDYAVIRLVPRVEREEFVNVGVILFCLKADFLGAQIFVDEPRIRAFSPDVDLATVRTHLEAIEQVCRGGVGAGPIGALPIKDRWHWLVAPRSTLIQTSPVHSGLCESPQKELERLTAKMVR